MEHVDMLQLARKLWRDRLTSRRLGDLETYILDFQREGIEVPGWMVPMLYKDYLFSGDARPLEGVFYHNQQDIVSLAALFIYSAELLNDPAAYPDIHDIDVIAIARLYEDLGEYRQSIQLYEKGLQGDLPVQYYIDTLMRFALLHKRQKNWHEAIHLWQRAVEFDQLDACVSLAKFYEHEARDYSQAILWTTRGIDIVEKSTSVYMKALELDGLQHRLDRLHRKNSSRAKKE
jgi:tetratricopeptide (TPR) repeat protein